MKRLLLVVVLLLAVAVPAKAQTTKSLLRELMPFSQLQPDLTMQEYETVLRVLASQVDRGELWHPSYRVRTAYQRWFWVLTRNELIRRGLLDQRQQLLALPTPRPVVPARPAPTGRFQSYSGSSSGLTGTGTQIPPFTFYNFSDGTSGTSVQMGNHRFFNFSDGTSGSSTQLGNFDFFNFNNHRFNDKLSGSTMQLGNQRFHNLDNGVSGTSTDIGGFSFHNFSNGTHCVTNRIGDYTYTTCY